MRRPEATPQTAAWAPSNLVALMSGSITIDEQGNIQVGDDTVQLSWGAPAEGVEWVQGYEVQRATCNGDFTTLVSDTGTTATAHADAEFEEGESYTYRVRGPATAGLSLWSGTQTLLVPGGTGESDCAAPFTALPSQVQDPQTGLLTPATLLNTLLGYDEAEEAGTLAPNELIFGEDGTFRVTSVNRLARRLGPGAVPHRGQRGAGRGAGRPGLRPGGRRDRARRGRDGVQLRRRGALPQRHHGRQRGVHGCRDRDLDGGTGGARCGRDGGLPPGEAQPPGRGPVHAARHGSRPGQEHRGRPPPASSV